MREIDCHIMSLSSPAEDIARAIASADSDVDGSQLDQFGYENTTSTAPDERCSSSKSTTPGAGPKRPMVNMAEDDSLLGQNGSKND
jgi:hypothetical protein